MVIPLYEIMQSMSTYRAPPVLAEFLVKFASDFHEALELLTANRAPPTPESGEMLLLNVVFPVQRAFEFLSKANAPPPSSAVLYEEIVNPLQDVLKFYPP